MSSKPLSSYYVSSKSMLSCQKYLPYLSVRISALVTTLDSWCGTCTASITYLKAIAEHKKLQPIKCGTAWNEIQKTASLPAVVHVWQSSGVCWHRCIRTVRPDTQLILRHATPCRCVIQDYKWIRAFSCRNIRKGKHCINQQLMQRHRRHVCKYRVTSQSVCTATGTWAPKYRYW